MRIKRDIIKNVNLSLYKVPFILVRFEGKLNLAKGFSKNTLIKYHENSTVWAKLFHLGGRTEGQTGRQTEGQTRRS
jgi:hypothetical protein